MHTAMNDEAICQPTYTHTNEYSVVKDILFHIFTMVAFIAIT